MAVFLLLLLVTTVAAGSRLDKEWVSWKQEHGKQYLTIEEESHRHGVWESNAEYIASHNSESDRHGYTLEMNEFGDLDSKEFSRIYNGYQGSSEISISPYSFFKPSTNGSIPSNIDWRDKGIVTGVKNQGKCGSCWAFSTTGSLESLHALKTGKLVSLSEQQLMDCSVKYGNHGCDGGLMKAAFQYIKDNGGDDTETSYPYTAKNESCRFNPKNVGATDRGFVQIPQADEVLLTKAVYEIGPISVAMDGGLSSFQFYKKGIYSDFACGNVHLNHGVLAVGYGEKDGKPYWLVKNSWGTNWGMDGYFMLARYVGNMCGVATDASYPLV